MRTRSPSGRLGVGQDRKEQDLDVIVLGFVGLVVQLLECRLVSLVHEEYLRWASIWSIIAVQQLTPELEGDRLITYPHEGLSAELVEPHVQRHENVLLRLEVVVEGRLGDAELLRDLSQAGAVEALLDEEIESHIEDSLAGVGMFGPRR